LKSEIHKIETHNRAILENAPDAFFLLDARSGRFIDCNKKAIEMLGWPREKILTFTPVDISTPISRDGRPAADGVRETLDSLTSGDPMVFEWDHVHADGRVIISEVRVQLLPSIKPPTLCGIISDITARKKNEEELKKAFAKIEDLSERLKQENILLRKELEKLHAHEEIVGESQRNRYREGTYRSLHSSHELPHDETPDHGSLRRPAANAHRRRTIWP
jgi:PAS domain S-box-containing protein